MKPIGADARTLTSHVLQTLRNAILEGLLEPERPIKIEEVARELNVSAIPVREAVLRLVSEGFVVSEPHKGYKVAPVSKADLVDIYTVRLMLEPEAARQAVGLLTERDIEDLTRLQTQIVASTETKTPTDTLAATREFHFRLYGILGSSRLLSTIAILWDQSERYRRLYVAKRERGSEVVEEHKRILTECIKRQPDRCAQAVVDDLNRTISALMAQLGSSETVSSAEVI